MKKVRRKILKVKQPKDKDKVCILTIDQSLNGSACIYTEDGELKNLWYCTDKRANMSSGATFINNKKLNNYGRLELIKEWFTVILNSVDSNTIVALEGYAYGGVGKVFELGELGGMIKMLIWEHGNRFMIIPPDSIKLFATGNGNATKSMMVASAITQHGKDFSVYKSNGEDLADAFWMNKLVGTIIEGRKDEKIVKKLPEHQKRALTNTKKKGKVPSLLQTEFIQRE